MYGAQPTDGKLNSDASLLCMENDVWKFDEKYTV